ncbi:hypothetical protein B0T19DRAFT_479337 [Cercophora scortea]|uniref:Uncharacterized protein n=1 Tax=Cercophora scortea TaxID=314031 RepID=A0AAE0M304_9PEZI|nr:hypothetical protein B0T19DRAFT_479337 [Cercophora scortea]
MAVPISQLLYEQPTNLVTFPAGLKTDTTNKKWTRDFHPTTNLIAHTSFDSASETVSAKWDAMLPLLADDDNTAKSSETIDVVYALDHPRLENRPLAVGVWKRNIIDPVPWQTGRLRPSGFQSNLSRELRGYAVKYKCPQVFCFDGVFLLLLQFRAATREDLKKEDCEVDCWILPRKNSVGGCTLRYGFYRLLAQGFRRCQGLRGRSVTVGGFAPESRE